MSIPLEPDYQTILLIDDEPGIRKIMSLDLTAEGYTVLPAPDGQTGLEVFERERPDLVLTDVKMPGMDGLEVLKVIKEISPDTEVIVITGHGDLETAITALQLDASDFITKPIKDEALAVALKRAKERLRLKAKLAAYTTNLEAKVAEATQKLVVAERLAAIGQTVASVAHSVKNMLAGLRGGVFMVQEGRKQAREELTDQGLGMLERNMRQIKTFVTDLLNLSKPRDLAMEPFDLRKVAGEAVGIMSLEAEAKVVDLALDEGGEGLTALGEKRLVIDALVNLISNALDAAAEVSQGRVRVRVGQAGSRVFCTVTDNGPGLSQEAEEMIGRGFFSTKGGGGTGLGLMVVTKTAREHGGTLEHHNLPDQGASFRFVLPSPPAKSEK